jgi:hypothetical protein
MSYRQRYLCAIAAVTVPTLIGLSLWAQNATPNTTGPKIAVINVQTIFRGLDEHKAIEANLRSLGDQIKKLSWKKTSRSNRSPKPWNLARSKQARPNTTRWSTTWR